MTNELYDVVGIKIATNQPTRLYAEGKTLRNAEASCDMAVMRRGVEEEIYKVVPAGSVVIPSEEGAQDA